MWLEGMSHHAHSSLLSLHIPSFPTCPIQHPDHNQEIMGMPEVKADTTRMPTILSHHCQSYVLVSQEVRCKDGACILQDLLAGAQMGSCHVGNDYKSCEERQGDRAGAPSSVSRLPSRLLQYQPSITPKHTWFMKKM